MPDKLETLLWEATASVHVQWAEPAQIRRRRRRHLLRAFAAVLAIAGLTAALRFTLAQPAGPALVTGPTPCPGVKLELPESESSVKLRVWHEDAQFAAMVATDFANRKFDVRSANMTLAEGEGVKTARILYGPKEIGAAWVVQAYLLNKAELRMEPARADGEVVVIVGPEFKQLATPTEMRQAIAMMGRPPVPMC